MTVFVIVLSILMFIIGILRISNGFGVKELNSDEKALLKKKSIKCILSTTLTIIFSILLYFCFEQLWSAEVAGLLAGGIVAGIFISLYYCITMPSQTTVNNRKGLKKINDEIKNNNIAIKVEFAKYTFAFDYDAKELMLIEVSNYSVRKILFEKIRQCELLEDNETIMKGGIGRAIVGGILAGGVGAIVGAATRKSQDVTNSLAIKIVIDSNLEPMLLFDLIFTQVQRSSNFYKDTYEKAQKVCSIIFNIIDKNMQNNIENKSDTLTDLDKLVTLYEKGFLTEEEFVNLKKKL